MIKKLLRYIGYNIIQFIKYLPFYWAMWLRNKCYKLVFKDMGEGSNICDGVTINYPHRVSIGQRVSIHPYCWISGFGGISIGNFVAISSGTKIISFNHIFPSTKIPIKEQDYIKLPIKIEDDVWIGANVIILGNISIGKGSVIGAGSVVTKNIPNYSIAVGNPCKVIKTRLKGH